MTAPEVRADYQSLQQVAASFGAQSDAARQSLAQLQRQMVVLQGGDWVGQGATAFYQEMDDSVMPTLKRLADALSSAQQSVTQISQIMQQAEADAAKVLRGPGGGAGGGPPGVMPSPAGGGAGAGASGGAAAGPQGAAFTGPLADQVAKMVAADNAAVDAKLKDFSPGLRALVKQSPALRAQIADLQQKGFSFKVGPTGKGGFTDQQQKTITIEQPLSDAATAAEIAHEVGHAENPQPPVGDPKSMTRDQFVQQSVQSDMRSEGEAQFNAAMVRSEIKANGGPDIGIPGTQTAAYQQVYDNTVAGNITKAQAVDQMGTLMGNEHTSIPPYQAYHDYYRDAYEFYWDTTVDEPPPPNRK